MANMTTAVKPLSGQRVFLVDEHITCPSHQTLHGIDPQHSDQARPFWDRADSILWRFGNYCSLQAPQL